MCVANPVVCVGRKGKIIMLYKGVSKNGALKGGKVRFSVAFADHPEGPFVKIGQLIFQPKDSDTHMVAEDPYIWYDNKADKYYAIVRDVIDQFTGENSGKLALMVSIDAITWKLTKHPKVLPPILQCSDGNVYDICKNGVERPFLYRDEDGIPRFLFDAFGVDKGNVRREHSFNGWIPLYKPNL